MDAEYETEKETVRETGYESGRESPVTALNFPKVIGIVIVLVIIVVFIVVCLTLSKGFSASRKERISSSAQRIKSLASFIRANTPDRKSKPYHEIRKSMELLENCVSYVDICRLPPQGCSDFNNGLKIPFNGDARVFAELNGAIKKMADELPPDISSLRPHFMDLIQLISGLERLCV